MQSSRWSAVAQAVADELCAVGRDADSFTLDKARGRLAIPVRSPDGTPEEFSLTLDDGWIADRDPRDIARRFVGDLLARDARAAAGIASYDYDAGAFLYAVIFDHAGRRFVALSESGHVSSGGPAIPSNALWRVQVDGRDAGLAWEATPQDTPESVRTHVLGAVS
jgi:hypothetical protein